MSTSHLLQSLLSLLLVMATGVVFAQEHPHSVMSSNLDDITPQNALANEASPYLLQHAGNPVNWYPWGPQALAKAKAEDKPIFLSVGYSTCYWCHAMERNVFENKAIADLLNRNFICIKVDREERPEIDQIYMMATKAITGQGGWPNSVWLTPEGKPWMAGTYFPPEAFTRLIRKLADLWSSDRKRVMDQAEQVTKAIETAQQGLADTSESKQSLDWTLIESGVRAIVQDFDPDYAGYGKGEKFPPHAKLRLIANQLIRKGDAQLSQQFIKTLDAMSQGGIRDHLGGGFHRYSIDREWKLPHFEKMLYDNAQLLRLFAEGYELTKRKEYREVAEGIVRWLDCEMLDQGGAFYAAVDSESEGHEGQYYVWGHKEIESILGTDETEILAQVYGIEPQGNWSDETTGSQQFTNILHFRHSLKEASNRLGLEIKEVEKSIQTSRKILLKVRDNRTHPKVDDKVLASWNGLMISSLAYAGAKLDKPEYIELAERAASFVLDNMISDNGKLFRTYRSGKAKQLGYLNDYAFMTKGLLELYDATNNRKWLIAAQKLADTMLSDFEDKENHGFYMPALQHESALFRLKNLLEDGNVPNGSAVAIEVLLRLSNHVSNDRYFLAAENAVRSTSDLMHTFPIGTVSLLQSASLYLQHLESNDRSPSQQKKVNNPDVDHDSHPVRVQLYASHLKASPGCTIQVVIGLQIADGWHLYAKSEGQQLTIPTKVGIGQGKYHRQLEVLLPKTTFTLDPLIGEKVGYLSGLSYFMVEVAVDEEAPNGLIEVPVVISYQACDGKKCIAPESLDLKLKILVQENATESDRHSELINSLRAILDTASND